MTLSTKNIGRIYKIVNTVNDDIYIGSTTLTLKRRFARHIYEMKILKDSNKMLFKLMREIGSENFSIELIEDVEYDSLKDLRNREGYWIKTMGTLNQVINGRTIKEYQQDNREYLHQKHQEWLGNNQERCKAKSKEWQIKNKDKLRQNQKEYYENNKDNINLKKKEYRTNNQDKIKEYTKKYRELNHEKIKERERETVMCECGMIVLRRQLKRHMSRQLHSKCLREAPPPVLA